MSPQKSEPEQTTNQGRGRGESVDRPAFNIRSHESRECERPLRITFWKKSDLRFDKKGRTVVVVPPLTYMQRVDGICPSQACSGNDRQPSTLDLIGMLSAPDLLRAPQQELFSSTYRLRLGPAGLFLLVQQSLQPPLVLGGQDT